MTTDLRPGLRMAVDILEAHEAAMAEHPGPFHPHPMRVMGAQTCLRLVRAALAELGLAPYEGPICHVCNAPSEPGQTCSAECAAKAAKADGIELGEEPRATGPECTGVSAQWCPVHGECKCPDREQDLADRDCPLHGPDSSHAEAPSVECQACQGTGRVGAAVAAAPVV